MTVFVDTNVLVYVRDQTEPDKQRKAAEWIAALWDTGLGRLSYQVLQEYYVTLTAKLDLKRPVTGVREDVAALRAWNPVGVDHATIERAWDVQDRYGYSWWDALIVAAALQAGCRYLLTEDLQPGQAIETATVISPFERDPDEILSSL